MMKNLNNFLQHKMDTDPIFFLTCDSDITTVRNALTTLTETLDMGSEERMRLRKTLSMVGEEKVILSLSDGDIIDAMFSIWKQVN